MMVILRISLLAVLLLVACGKDRERKEEAERHIETKKEKLMEKYDAEFSWYDSLYELRGLYGFYTIKCQEMLPPGKIIGFAAPLKDIYKKSGRIHLLFEPLTFEPMLNYRITCDSIQANEIRKLASGFWLGDDYIIVCEVIDVSNIVYNLYCSEEEYPSVELGSSNTILISGRLIDWEYIGINTDNEIE